MQPATHERISGNAFRILGLPGDASQQAIEAAARRMRIWPSPERIPCTAWDLPWVGKLSRSRIELEQALSRLNEPQSRVQERLYWFGAANGQLKAESPLAADASARQLALETDPALRHDGILAELGLALLLDRDVQDIARWQRVLSGLRELAASPAYLNWLLDAERRGDFEKRAEEAEVIASLSELPAAANQALASRAEGALLDDDLACCARIARLVDEPGLNRRILDRMEETLERRCNQIRNELQQSVQPLDHYSVYQRNADACRAAAGAYNESVDRLLVQIEELGGAESDRTHRVRFTCARFLAMLGLGWMYAHDFVTAEQTLQIAAPMAAGTALEEEIHRRLAENQQRAAAQRRYQLASENNAVYAAQAAQAGAYMGGAGLAGGNRVVRPYPVSYQPGPAGYPGQRRILASQPRNGSKSILWVLIVGIVAVVRFLSYSSNSSSNSYNPQIYSVPNYRSPYTPSNPSPYTPPRPTPYRPPGYTPPAPYRPSNPAPASPGRR